MYVQFKRYVFLSLLSTRETLSRERERWFFEIISAVVNVPYDWIDWLIDWWLFFLGRIRMTDWLPSLAFRWQREMTHPQPATTDIFRPSSLHPIFIHSFALSCVRCRAIIMTWLSPVMGIVIVDFWTLDCSLTHGTGMEEYREATVGYE
jgi:hypothetical protein